MGYEKDFVNEEVVELSVIGYEKGDWTYKLVDAKTENDWLDEYMVIDKETGVMRQDLTKINWLKLRNIIKCPYDKELIKKIINVEKEFSELSLSDKKALFGKLKPTVFTNLIQAVKKADDIDEEAKN